MKVKQTPAKREVTLVQRSGWLTAANPMVSHASRMAPWIVTLWLVAITGWYIKTAVNAVRYPINEGDQMRLAMVWLILVAAVVLSHLLLRRRIVTLVWALALIAAGLVMIILSRQSVSALITIWLLALGWTWGDWLLRRMGAKSSKSQLQRVSCLTRV